jgi:hypothetical protein
VRTPYNWQSHNPQVQIPRAEVGRVAELLRENGSAVVMGGRGMGKSVFLGQLKAELEREPGTKVLLVKTPASRRRRAASGNGSKSAADRFRGPSSNRPSAPRPEP